MNFEFTTSKKVIDFTDLKLGDIFVIDNFRPKDKLWVKITEDEFRPFLFNRKDVKKVVADLMVRKVIVK